MFLVNSNYYKDDIWLKQKVYKTNDGFSTRYQKAKFKKKQKK